MTPMLRVLHTSDWHLGQRLHDLPRTREHQAFLDWLAGTLAREAVDALVVAGDVFDAANPPTSALEAWYRFLAQVAWDCPGLQVVVIGGNHDSAARLDAPRAVLAALRVTVVGGLPRRADRTVDSEALVVPLRRRDGEVRAWVAAVPYLRAADLPATSDLDGAALVAGVRAIYAEALAAARARRAPGQALLATGHCYCVGTQVTESSERKVLLGNQHPLPVDLFGEDVDYVALGHLHLGQAVAGRAHVRYSGAPLPLSLAEARREHQVVLADFAGGALAEVRTLAVPRAVAMRRVPETGAAPLSEVRAALAALPARPEGVPAGDESLPWLEVQVRLEAPEPGLRAEVEGLLADRAARLVRLGVERPGGASAAQAGADAPVEALADLLPEEVFRRLYGELYGAAEPDPALLAAFHEMVEAAERPDDDAPEADAPALESPPRGAPRDTTDAPPHAPAAPPHAPVGPPHAPAAEAPAPARGRGRRKGGAR